MSQNRIETGNRLSAATFAGGRGTTTGLIGSVLLHVLIVGAALFTFAHKLDVVPSQESPIVPVDLITIADKTNIRAAVKQPPKAKPVEEKPVEVPQPEKAEPTQQEKAVATPPPPPPQAETAPILLKPPPPAVEKPKPQPDAKPKKEKFDIDSVSALLNKVSPTQKSAPNARLADRNIKGAGAQDAMTADLQDAMLSMIKECWSPPVGAPHAEDLIVDFEMVLNPDGSIQKVASDALTSSNSYTKAAASAARRAIYECAPYKLPADRFKDWHDIMLTFDPRQMMGQQ